MLIFQGKTNIFSHEYTKELNNLINQSYQGNSKSQAGSHFSYTLEKLMIQSGASEVLDMINCGLTFIEVIFYIISTYTYPEEDSQKETTNKIINIIEIIFLSYFIIHYVLRLYISQNRLLFFFDLLNMIDISSFVCIILSKQNFVEGNVEYYLRMFRMIRFLYLLKIEDFLQRRSNDQIRYSYKLVASLVGIIFLSSAIVLEVENAYNRDLKERENDPNIKNPYTTSGDLYRFHDILYFEFVTLTTIGFGDVYPKSTLGRLATICTIVMIIGVIPALYSKLSIVFSLTSKYSRVRYSKNNKVPNHLVLLGECSPESFDACLQELYHDDHGNIDFDTVIMQLKPNEEMLKIYNRKKYKNQIFYLAGNILEYQDLERARVEQSICVIILANKLTNNYQQEDFNNILKAFSIKKYSNMICGPNKIRVCIQLLLPETKKIYYSSLLRQNEYDENAQLICVEELKLQILGKSCLCQGINTIIASLITSEKPTKDGIKFNTPVYLDWFDEYLEGLENEIYCIKIRSEILNGLTFIQLVKILYELTGFIIIGTDLFFKDLKPFVCLNPSNYLFAPFDHLLYLLASSQPNEKEINELLEKYLEEKRKGTIENNIEMVKIRRLKNAYWCRLNADGSVKKDSPEDADNDCGEELDAEGQNDDEEKDNELLTSIKLRINTENDDYNFTKNYLVTPKPRTRRDSETYNYDMLKRHIIIFGINQNIKNLIMPLRAVSNGCLYPILIMDKAEHIPQEIWKEICRFPDIYYMQGNAIKSDDLKKAGIAKAKAAIILSKYTAEEELIEMMDANTIFIYQAVKNENKKMLLLVDLVSVGTIGYICPTEDENIESHGFWLSQAFASGELFISSMLDTLICQSFYNPFLLIIISQMMLGDSAFKLPEDAKAALKSKKLIQACLNLYKISECLEEFKNQTAEKEMEFRQIFEIFLQKNMLPIGILRQGNSGNNKNISGKYVFLAPSKEVMIDIKNDSIYVLNYNDKRRFDEESSEADPKEILINKGNEIINDFDNKLSRTLAQTNNIVNDSLSNKSLTTLIKECMENEFIKIYKNREIKAMEEAEKIAKDEVKKMENEGRENINNINNNNINNNNNNNNNIINTNSNNNITSNNNNNKTNNNNNNKTNSNDNLYNNTNPNNNIYNINTNNNTNPNNNINTNPNNNNINIYNINTNKNKNKIKIKNKNNMNNNNDHNNSNDNINNINNNTKYSNNKMD